MKNAMRIIVIALTTLAFSGISFAQAKPATPATPAAPAIDKKMETAAEKMSEKGDDSSKAKKKAKSKSKTKKSTKTPAGKTKMEEKAGDVLEKKTK